MVVWLDNRLSSILKYLGMKYQKSLQLTLKWSKGEKKPCACIYRDKTMCQILQLVSLKKILLKKIEKPSVCTEKCGNHPLLTPHILHIFANSVLVNITYLNSLAPQPPTVTKTLHIVPSPPHQLQEAHDPALRLAATQMYCGTFWVPTGGHSHHKQFPILENDEALP